MNYGNKACLFLLVLGISSLYLGGCTTLGPTTVARDRFEYTDAISESWKRQMLLNLVKIRYGDAPIFLDVSAIISQYALETELQGSLGWNAFVTGNSQSLGGAGRFSDRPTITYQPIVGEKFARSLMTPIRPAAILSLIEAGYRADYVLRVCSQSVNGLDNSNGSKMEPKQADPEFYALIQSLKKIQDSSAVGMRIKTEEDQIQSTLLVFRREHVEPEILAEMKKTRELLGLEPDRQEFKVVYGALSKEKDEIAILSRSMLSIFAELGAYIDVPDDHVAEQRVIGNSIIEADREAGVSPLMRIYSGQEAPPNEDVFIAVPYRDHWFWIDDRDFSSKSLFSFMMFLFTLAETGSPSQAPLITIPTG